MGKYKKKVAAPIKEIPTGFSGSTTDCYRELTRFFECMQKSNFDVDTKCARESADLMACSEAAVKKPKVKSTMNYHLQRLARVLRR
mmetsp:Transcript_38370/g.91008  ORF Transcript_38370/g.91008 Transcript_38370/m.91008 type:complete len:86 (+) Transcript_38370:78-335(+)